MKRIKRTTLCSVDAGNITLMVAERSDKKTFATTEISCEAGAGVYKAKLMIPRTWNGKRQKTFQLFSRSGKFILGDACYSIDEGWSIFLEESAFMTLQCEDKSFGCIETGGDGEFIVDYTLEYLRPMTETETKMAFEKA